MPLRLEGVARGLDWKAEIIVIKNVSELEGVDIGR